MEFSTIGKNIGNIFVVAVVIDPYNWLKTLHFIWHTQNEWIVNCFFSLFISICHNNCFVLPKMIDEWKNFNVGVWFDLLFLDLYNKQTNKMLAKNISKLLSLYMNI